MISNEVVISNKKLFWINKRIIDFVLCTFLLPLLLFFTVSIIIFNKFYDNGSVFFVQKRMGKDCKPFYAIKFRTMIPIDKITRKHSEPIEVDRITTLGRILRNTRIDELPQILNVLRGDMSLIGPRPDYYDHALFFIQDIPEYRLRYSIKPGISGLSQIRLGYAEGIDATRKKSNMDIFYIENANFKLDAKIFFGTIYTILRFRGN